MCTLYVLLTILEFQCLSIVCGWFRFRSSECVFTWNLYKRIMQTSIRIQYTSFENKFCMEAESKHWLYSYMHNLTEQQAAFVREWKKKTLITFYYGKLQVSLALSLSLCTYFIHSLLLFLQTNVYLWFGTLVCLRFPPQKRKSKWMENNTGNIVYSLKREREKWKNSSKKARSYAVLNCCWWMVVVVVVAKNETNACLENVCTALTQSRQKKTTNHSKFVVNEKRRIVA